MRQYKDQEVGLNPAITVHCGGATPITTQQTTSETMFLPRMVASTMKRLQREHVTPLFDSFDLTACPFSWHVKSPGCLLVPGKGCEEKFL